MAQPPRYLPFVFEKRKTLPRIAEGLARWSQTLETSLASLAAAQTKTLDAEATLVKNGARLAALRTASQRLTIGQETVDAALELLWAEESRLSEELAELEAGLSLRPMESAEHADAARLQAKAGAQQTTESLGEVQRSLGQLTAAIQLPAPRTIALTQTEEELREALSQLTSVLNVHLNTLLWTQQESDELERALQSSVKDSRSILR